MIVNTTTVSGAPSAFVPKAKNITIAIEAFRHLQQTPNTPPPSADGVYNYDEAVYKANGFDPTANPNEVFLVEATPGAGPSLDLRPKATPGAAQNSGGIGAPSMAANAITRATGPVGGSTAPGSPIMTKQFSPTDYFGAKPDANGTPDPGSFFSTMKLFGFLQLSYILDAIGLGTDGSSFMPKSVTQDISKAEEILSKAVQIYGLLSSLLGDDSGTAGQIGQVLKQLENDIDQFAQIAQGIPAAGTPGSTPGLSTQAGAPFTNAQMQEAAWRQSAATQAQYLIKGYVADLVNIWKKGEKVYNDIAGPDGPDFDSLISYDFFAN
jgi:hypothetical protein